MVMHMRTTINLPEGLGEEAKRHAAQRGCTFTALVVEASDRRCLSEDSMSLLYAERDSLAAAELTAGN